MFELSGFRLEWVCSPIRVSDDGGWVWSDRNDDGWVCSPIGGVMMVVGSERERERASERERQ